MTVAIRQPGPGEVVYLATGVVDDSARDLCAQIGRRLPCITGLEAYGAQRDRIWGIVNWANSNLAESFATHGLPARFAWLHQSGVGVEAITPLGVPETVTVTSIKGGDYVVGPMAEHAVARMLEWSKGLPRLRDQQRARLWRQFDPPSLAGRTVMIFGAGGIGLAVLQRLAGFGMRSILVRRNTAIAQPGVETIDLPTALGRLGEADHLVVALPLTAETRGVFGAAEIARLKPTAFIVNIGRAAVFDEAALGTALREDRLGGIAFDVFWREPLQPDDPLWHWPRTAITPHMSANVEGGNSHFIIGTALTTLDRVLAGAPLVNLVNLAAGY